MAAAGLEEHQKHTGCTNAGGCGLPVVSGVARLLMTRGVGYQHPIAEYGMHWNFFFSLAFVKLATAAVPIPMEWSAAAGDDALLP